MSTNSTIAIKRKDGTIQGIYCHWDGYLSYNGAMLLEHYSDPVKLERLIAMGAISSLKPETDPTGEHSFENPQENVVVAYHRDRGESLEHMDKYGPQEYNYLYDEVEGKWYWGKGQRKMIELTPEMCSDKIADWG